MDLVDLVDLACQILRKPALQATLRVFGLCGSCVDHVWSALRFLVMCGRLCGFWVGGLARPLARRSLWIGGLALDGLALDADADGCPQVLRVHLLFLDC